jgi:hypothetical protein
VISQTLLMEILRAGRERTQFVSLVADVCVDEGA